MIIVKISASLDDIHLGKIYRKYPDGFRKYLSDRKYQDKFILQNAPLQLRWCGVMTKHNRTTSPGYFAYSDLWRPHFVMMARTFFISTQWSPSKLHIIVFSRRQNGFKSADMWFIDQIYDNGDSLYNIPYGLSSVRL